MKSYLPITILIVVCNICNSQLYIDTTSTPESLVENILLNSSSLIKIKQVTYKGNPKSIGQFHIRLEYNESISDGIILSTGDVFNAIGPNSRPSISTNLATIGDKDLNLLSNGYTYDASILEIDFTTSTDSISFNFFFASEEYPEYAGRGLNDIFAFFLMDESNHIIKNLAVLPSSNIPICTDNINQDTNSQYYISNASWNKSNMLKWKNDPKMGELAYTFQFDGFTTIFKVGTKLKPFQNYRLKLAIADVADPIYDSAIFLEANSFKSEGKIHQKSNAIADSIHTKFNALSITTTDSTVIVKSTIQFALNSDQINGDNSFYFLDKVFYLLKKNPDLEIEIHGHTDQAGTKAYNQTLSENRALNVSDYLITKGINKRRIKAIGFGDTKPISQTEESSNRRVEFVFKHL